MAMFLKPKPLAQQVEDRQAKIRLKQLDVAEARLDVDKIQARRQKAMELKRLTA